MKKDTKKGILWFIKAAWISFTSTLKKCASLGLVSMTTAELAEWFPPSQKAEKKNNS